MLYESWEAFAWWRLVDKTPTVSIARVHNQLAEVTGSTVEGEALLVSPINRIECVFYRTTIQEWKGSGKSGRWETAHQEASQDPIYIEDGTGRARILPQSATTEFEKDFERFSGALKGDAFPAKVKTYLHQVGVESSAFLGLHPRLRCEEIFIRPGEQLYVLGWGTKKDDLVEFAAQGPETFIISDFSEKKLRAKYRKEMWENLLFGIFLVVVFAVLASTLMG